MKQTENKKNLFSLFEPVVIIIFWIILFASPLYLGEDDISWDHIFIVWKDFIPYLILFLFNRFVFLPFLFFKNKRTLFIIANIFIIAFMAFGIYAYKGYNNPPEDRPALREHPMERPGEGHPPPPGHERARLNNPKPPIKHIPPYISFMAISILIVGFDTGLKLSVKWVHSEQKRVSAEKENVESQLAFLKNQVSPHFFMNTLNNIHSLIDIDKEEAKESIIKLSKLMRHLLYDSEVEKISIQKEFDFISNYVDIMKLRYSDKVKINLEFTSGVGDKNIPPLLFTSFVENAFKYGVSYQSDSFIDISFNSTSDRLEFEIKNSISEQSGEKETGGIGIENSRKRLDLLFGENYTLAINETEKVYTVKLNIPV